MADDNQDIIVSENKELISQEEEEEKSSSKTWLWILIGVIIIIVILFIIGIFVFFVFFNEEPMHEITIFNNNMSQATITIGATGTARTFSPIMISAGQSIVIQASPGVSLYVASLDSQGNSQTKTILALAGANISGTGKIIYNNTTIDGLPRNAFTQDKYGVSVQKGFNITMSIAATANFSSTNGMTCNGPTWTNSIQQDDCPDELQILTSAGAYVACSSACSAIGGVSYCCTNLNSCSQVGGCQATWEDPDFYTTFSVPCPTCMITNCDTLNYTCNSKSSSELTKYTITIAPNIV